MPDPDFTAPFDNELGLQFTELTPDGARAQLEVKPKLLQPMGLVHGGVYCSMIESMASVAAFTWLAAQGGGNVVGVNNNTDFLRSIKSGTVYGKTKYPSARPCISALAPSRLAPWSEKFASPPTNSPGMVDIRW